MSKLTYVKPSVTKMGSVTEKTEGGWKAEIMELFTLRGAI